MRIPRNAIGVSALLLSATAMADGLLDTGKATLIDNAINVEDLVQINDSWIIGSSFSIKNQPTGLYLFNTHDRRPQKVDWSQVRVTPDKSAFPDCPDAPNFARLSSHGLDYYREAGRLYVVNHGGRESVEVFTINAENNARPTLSWQGCVIAPHNAWFDAVAGLSNNQMIISSLWDPTDAQRNAKLKAGQPVGGLYHWSPRAGLQAVKGSEALSGPNGVLASRDGKTLWVAAWAEKNLVRIKADGREPQVSKTPVDFHPDNLRWSADGKHIIAGGQATDLDSLFACLESPESLCPGVNQRLDLLSPTTMKTTPLLSATPIPGMHAGTGAIAVNGEYWLGSFKNNAIAVIPE